MHRLFPRFAFFVFTLIPCQAGAGLIQLAIANGIGLLDERPTTFRDHRVPLRMFDGKVDRNSFFRMGSGGSLQVQIDDGFVFEGSVQISEVTYNNGGDRKWRECARVYWANDSERVFAGYLVNSANLSSFEKGKGLVLKAFSDTADTRSWRLDVPEGEWTTLEIEDCTKAAFRSTTSPDGFDIGELSFSTRLLPGPPDLPEPLTISLLGIGVLAVGAAASRRRRS